MKKVLFILNRMSGGGAERVATTLTNELCKNNNEVKLVVYKKMENTYGLNDKIECKFLSSNGKFEKIKRIFELRNIIKEYNPDTIIAFEYFVNMQVIIANLGFKNRLVISERNDPAREGHNKRLLRNFLYNFADILVCQTNEAKAYFPKTIQKKSVVILNPLKPDLPKPWNGNRRKEIVNFCRLEKQKNIPLLIDAFEIVHKQYNDYVLSIYGKGSEESNIKEYISKKKLQDYVKVLPPTNEIHNKIRDSKMFVSSSDYEGLSNSMLEAMAIGLPVICTDCPCGGARMVIENNVNGILVPIKNANVMADEMKSIIENNQLANLISRNAIEINKKLNNNIICSEWEKIL